jgi:conjugative relaxase-like TrwC/TraI family protein
MLSFYWLQWGMLRINQQCSAAGARSYFQEGLAHEDYYTRDEIIGRWGGRGAERLGLTGAVSREDFHALCENRHPQTGQRLTLRTREGRTVGYDFNWHAPKSLSLLYAMTGDWRILAAFQQAVRQSMQELETEVKARVRRGGQNTERVTGNLLFAEFVHLTTRPVGGIPDPHLHAHCFVFNATFDEVDHAWKAAQFREVVRDAPYFEAAFHARLSKEIAALGYGVERTAKGWEVAGLSPELLDKFSRRTQQIEEVARAKGITSPQEKATLGARTREKKGEGQPLEALRKGWHGRLRPPEQQALANVASHRVRSRAAPVSAREAVDHALRHGFERSSVMTDKRLLAVALKRGYGSVDVEQVKGELVARHDVIRQRYEDQTYVTTRQVLAEETEVIAFARNGRGACVPLAHWEDTLPPSGLNRDQQAAVRHVLTSLDRILLIRGAAGTGKTALLRTAAAALAANGKRVHVFAPTAEAARGVLRREGFDQAETVARLVNDRRLQSKLQGQVLWIDEAGLLGVQDLRKIFQVAKEQNARVVLVGDERQHGAVARGDAFRLLQQHAGLRAAEVRDIRRQHGEYKAAVEALACGDLAAGLERLDRLGAIYQVKEEDRHRHLAADYLAAVREGKAALVVAPTHAEGQKVTARLRDALRTDGRLGEKERIFRRQESLGLTEAMRQDPVNYRKGDVVQFHQNARGFRKGERLTVAGHDEQGRVFVQRPRSQPQLLPMEHARHFDVYASSELRIAVGERLRITQNGMTADGKGRLINGSLHTVVGFDRRGDILLENGQAIARDFGHLAHGYCTTSHASQGKTVDRVFVALGKESFPAASQEQFYVGISRGRESCKVYCTNKQELRDAVSRSSERLTATELTGQKHEVTSAGRARMLRHGGHLRRQQSEKVQRADRDQAADRSRSAAAAERPRERGRDR